MVETPDGLRQILANSNHISPCWMNTKKRDPSVKVWAECSGSSQGLGMGQFLLKVHPSRGTGDKCLICAIRNTKY